MSNSTPLAAKYDGRKSFYGKALVKHEDGKTILQSYSTDVAYIEGGLLTGPDRLVVNGKYSATTARHIREFMKQYGFMAAAQMPWAKVMETYGPDVPAQVQIDAQGIIAAPTVTAPAADLVLFG